MNLKKELKMGRSTIHYADNKTFTGSVRKDGTIEVNRKKFTFPSLAVNSIVNYSVYGWHKWKYERSPGEWILIDELRKQKYKTSKLQYDTRRIKKLFQ